MRIKRIKINKKYIISFVRSGLIDGGEGWDYINISLRKIAKTSAETYHEKIFCFNIKDFNLIKFNTSV